MDRVLVVDDEEFMRELLAMALKGLGFEAVMAVDGQDALEQFQAAGNPFCTVIMDIRMPRMDGIEATRRIKEIRPDTKIILISGNDQPITSMADAYLSKPFRINELSDLLNTIHGGDIVSRMARG